MPLATYDYDVCSASVPPGDAQSDGGLATTLGKLVGTLSSTLQRKEVIKV